MITLGARTLLLLGIAGSGFAACSTQEKVNRTLDEVYKLAKNLNSAAEAAKAGFAQAPKSPGSAQSVTRGRSATGLPAASAEGQTATFMADVDGDGSNDTVNAFEDSSSGTTFYSAELEACDESGACETVCVTLWEVGTTLYSVAGYCGVDDFAYCIEESGAEAVCESCNASGCGVSEPTEQPSGDALSCQGFVECVNSCEDEACGTSCEAAASQAGLDQANAVASCLNANSGDESACQAEIEACQ